MTPILSVVIPTYNRPDMLDRAIRSALQSAAQENVEVLVVPNGPHTSWKRVELLYRDDTRVRWLPILQSHACSARNHGLSNSVGAYVRFLDDDDYLLPEAREQLEDMIASNADISAAPSLIVNSTKPHTSLQPLPSTSDFISACILSIAINNMNAGCIYLRTGLARHKWREDVVLYDDYLWMIELAELQEFSYRKFRSPVVAYVEHDGARLSRIRRSRHNSQPIVDAILKLHKTMGVMGRETPERTEAAAISLLTHAHSAFPSAPFFLSDVIKQARIIAPGVRPLQSLFSEGSFLLRNMLAAEWLLIAPRYLTRGYRRASWAMKGMFSRAKRSP